MFLRARFAFLQRIAHRSPLCCSPSVLIRLSSYHFSKPLYEHSYRPKMTPEEKRAARKQARQKETTMDKRVFHERSTALLHKFAVAFRELQEFNEDKEFTINRQPDTLSVLISGVGEYYF